MPELPEVERIRSSLARHLPGRKVRRVQIARADVVRGGAEPTLLLAGDRIAAIDRRGKQLALVGESGRCVCVHLGMTGSLVWGQRDRPAGGTDHVHLIWQFDPTGPSDAPCTLRFRDPRRFGGLWTFATQQALYAQRWHALGEDALRVTPMRLHRQLQGTRRALKAALLDQNLVAGLGNIYVDELLFACGLAPGRLAHTLSPEEARKLVRRMRSLLHRAIASGGSTLRDYVDGDGAAGGFQRLHRVYGRGGSPCRRCRRTLATAVVAGRTTVFCGACQGV